MNSVRLLYKYILGLLRDLAGRTLTQKTTILSGLQIILYSPLIFFTNIFLSEARTLVKYRNNLGEILSNTEDTFYFTQRSTARGSKNSHVHSPYSWYFLISIKTSLCYKTQPLHQISEAQWTFNKHNIPDRFIREIDLQAKD